MQIQINSITVDIIDTSTPIYQGILITGYIIKYDVIKFGVSILSGQYRSTTLDLSKGPNTDIFKEIEESLKGIIND